MNTALNSEDRKNNILNRLRNSQLREKQERFLTNENESTAIYPKFETSLIDSLLGKLDSEEIM